MKKTILITMLLLALSLMLFAQKDADKPCDNCDKEQMMPKGDNGPDEMGMHKERMKDLGLSKEQMQKLEDLRQEHQKFMNTKKAEIKNLQIDKENAMESGGYDKVKAINKQISDLELAIANAKVDHHQAMMKELTKEQQEKFNQMMHKKGGPQPQDMGPGHMKMHKGPRK